MNLGKWMKALGVVLSLPTAVAAKDALEPAAESSVQAGAPEVRVATLLDTDTTNDMHDDTTLLRSINRMNDLIPGSHVSGELYFDGQNIYDPQVDVVSLRRRVGMVFQKSNPFPMSIYENVVYALRIDGENRKTVEPVLQVHDEAVAGPLNAKVLPNPSFDSYLGSERLFMHPERGDMTSFFVSSGSGQRLRPTNTLPYQ